MTIREHVVLLSGGVGGAKLALGLVQVLPPESLTVIVNTGDDFRHLGLHVSPDLDTVMYALSGLADPDKGWGIQGDSLLAMEMVQRLGGESWFNLGDRDLGTNLMRTSLLQKGKSLTDVTGQMTKALGIQHPVLPMTDAHVRTWIETDQGPMPFQTYFVREHWQPVIRGIAFVGAEHAYPGSQVVEALEQATLIVIGPSNPYLSIDPILSIQGIRERVQYSRIPVIAVSPIIAGKAVKGPTVKIMHEAGIDASPVSVAKHYREVLNAIILDDADRELCAEIEQNYHIKTTTSSIYMETLEDKTALAATLLNWSEENLS